MASADPPDDLHDAALADDIALLGDMMAAAAADGGRGLTEAEVDVALGLTAQDSAAERGRARRRRQRLLRSRRVRPARRR